MVIHGHYRHVRNPMISGIMVILAGETLLVKSWCLVTAFHHRQPALSPIRGGARLRRTLWPRLPRLQGAYTWLASTTATVDG
jgi:hypothetical protein